MQANHGCQIWDKLCHGHSRPWLHMHDAHICLATWSILADEARSKVCIIIIIISIYRQHVQQHVSLAMLRTPQYIIYNIMNEYIITCGRHLVYSQGDKQLSYSHSLEVKLSQHAASSHYPLLS